ncbi:MAG: radical SAM protein [Gemmatimonadales bacterium]|nr:radical SAM protein [Gemmatimonadales bacterium]NIN10591.1 radical SAM protein [Gemmatimonadales bacterium]NIN49353.1 radical SAM protein [Gemmatimonadales bacterium]NIP06817.1 radical SAM protein [Gemmatimonadales bacterium]NIR01493.1 radical SAM protein [Gemmatimonadales bacterium]
MRIVLVAPCVKDPARRGAGIRLPQMGLALLAGMTPKQIDVAIMDDLPEPIDLNGNADLVGITASTKTAVRAYEIADELRGRGVRVILGGIHATVAPHEAIEHADSVVVGEAEDVWAQVLEDCRNGRLRKLYRSGGLSTLENAPTPRRDLFERTNYDTVNVVQATRGCPFSCHFCSVSAIYGKGLRLRPIDDVVAEINALDGDELFLADDNIVGRSDYAKQLLRRMIPLRKQWLGQATVKVARDPALLELLQQSGCMGLCLGFETPSIAGLREIGKRHNEVSCYAETVRKLHDKGVSIVGSFIVGLDSDDDSCFETLLEFALRSKIDAADVHILTPYPGTVLYQRLKQQGRLLDNKWWLTYDPSEVVYLPRLMTREQLRDGWRWTRREFYKLRPTLTRCIEGSGRRSVLGNVVTWKVNMAYRKAVMREPG